MIDLLFFILFSFAGIILGIITGLLPGLHPNNIALMVLSLVPWMVAGLTSLDPNLSAILVCVLIVSCAITNVFFMYIQSTFLGAPDPETALSVLPGHYLLTKGEGYKAISLTALGCMGGIIFVLLALLPLRFFVDHFGSTIRGCTAYILIAISLLLILFEMRNGITTVIISSLVFATSGLFGMVVLDMPVRSPLGLPTTVLFPVFTGLFGISTLLVSLRDKPHIIEQKITEPVIDRSMGMCIIKGSLAGCVIGFLPGLGPAQATIVASLGRSRAPEHIITTLAAVCSAEAFFALAAFFMIGAGRSGAMIAVSQIISSGLWEGMAPPHSMIYMMMGVILSASVSYFLVKLTARRFAEAMQKIPYDKITISVIIFLLILIWVFSGILGLVIMAVATAIGLIPIMLGTKRSHLMAILIVPIVFRLLGVAY